MNSMKNVKEHFEQESTVYDPIIIQLIPFYEQMVETLVLSIPFPKSAPIRVMDLGCGTGTIALKVKLTFPNARITCLDMAESMIQMAQSKLSQYPDITYQVGDFVQYEFAPKNYEVMVSSLAMHHLVNDAAKKMLYQKIFAALTTGGVFYNADLMLGTNDSQQAVNIHKWTEFMNRSISKEEIEEKWLVKYRDEDHPTSLMNHLQWLAETGFKDIDVIWKYYNFAVYGGYKY